MTYKCSKCGRDNAFVNQCGCDPNNMPTRPQMNERQQSLFAILDRAREAAAECGERVYIIDAPLYVDEFAEGCHVFGPQPACQIMFREPRARFEAAQWQALDDKTRERLRWHIDASVEPNGEIFYTRVEDILAEVGLKRPDVIRKINVHLVDDGA